MNATHLDKQMIAFFDEKLKGNTVAQYALENNNPRLFLIEVARSLVGVREVGGNNRGPIVKLLQLTIGDANGEAWCMATVQTCVAYTCLKFGIKNHLFPSEHCLTVKKYSPVEMLVVSIPRPGAIAIYQHGNTSNGHTGIVLEYNIETGFMYLIEGNVEHGIDANGAEIRQGGGVYLTKRHIKGDGDMKVVGFLKPFLLQS